VFVHVGVLIFFINRCRSDLTWLATIGMFNTVAESPGFVIEVFDLTRSFLARS
jgi:hypothetical protein